MSFSTSLKHVSKGYVKQLQEKPVKVTAFRKMIDEGHLEHYQNDIKFIRDEHGKEWILGKVHVEVKGAIL